MVHDTDIVELELKSKRFSLAVRKKEALESPEPAPMAYQVLPGLRHRAPSSRPSAPGSLTAMSSYVHGGLRFFLAFTDVSRRLRTLLHSMYG
jgi:hypothetical protein